MIKLKNVLIENMKRFRTTNLNEAPQFDTVLDAKKLPLPTFAPGSNKSGFMGLGTGKPNQKLPIEDFSIKATHSNVYEIIFPRASVKPGEFISIGLNLPDEWKFTVREKSLEKSPAAAMLYYNSVENKSRGDANAFVSKKGGGAYLSMDFEIPYNVLGYKDKPYADKNSMPRVAFSVDNAYATYLFISCDCSNLQYYPSDRVRSSL